VILIGLGLTIELFAVNSSEIDKAYIEYQEAFKRYTSMVTTNSSDKVAIHTPQEVNNALNEYRQKYTQYKHLKEQEPQSTPVTIVKKLDTTDIDGIVNLDLSNADDKTHFKRKSNIKLASDSDSIIFDGNGLGEHWKACEIDLKLSKYGTFEKDCLSVDVPEDHGWGRVGIESNETLIHISQTDQSNAYHLKFVFDSNRTTAYVIEFEGVSESVHSYSNIKVIYKTIDENVSVMELHKDGELNSQLEMKATAPQWINFVIQPNHFAYAVLPDGKYLQTTSTKYTLPQKGYKLKVYTQGKKYKQAAKMALKTISLRTEPFNKRANISNLGEKERKIVLFDGKYFEDVWDAYNEQYQKHFLNYSHFDDNQGWLIDVPKDNKWGEAGFFSRAPIVWLDGLENGGEINVTFGFEPSQTTGLSIAFGDINAFWKCPNEPYANFLWSVDRDGVTSSSKMMIDNEEILSEKSTKNKFGNMVISFKNGEISLHTDVMANKTFKWSHIAPNRGLYLFVYTHSNEKNKPVKMMLKQILLENNTLKASSPPSTAQGVEPLPKKDIFNTSFRENWECYDEKEKEPISYCSIGALGYLVEIPQSIKSVDGIRTKTPISTFDERIIQKTNYKIVMTFNPKKTNNFDIAFEHIHVTLEKIDQGMYRFNVGKQYMRNIEAQWIENVWNGKLNIVQAKDWTEFGLDGSVTIRTSEKFGNRFQWKISTLPPSDYKLDNAMLELQKITTQWITPNGMNAAQRWGYVDDEDFDPDGFLNDIREMKE